MLRVTDLASSHMRIAAHLSPVVRLFHTNSAKMSKRISYTVEGKVQGVCFRDFTQQKANAYGLTGWVRNTRDGSVQLEAQGDEGALQKLEKDLNQGPSAASVSKVTPKSVDLKSGESEFICTR